MDAVRRFSSKAEKYARYRWDYALKAIDAIFDITQISPEAAVADIGSGTGMLSRHFVDRVKHVFAIEPNLEMRKIADNFLGQNLSFINIDGLSDATTLPDKSVELITVGRAIYWFTPDSTKSEFLRILKPGGWLAILQIPTIDQELLKELTTLNLDKKPQRVPLSFYYESENFLKLDFPSTKQETWEKFMGRLTSLSPAQDEDSILYSNFAKLAKEIFNKFSSGKIININISTEVYLGQMNSW
jgi:ubiquinone/menaquinone biosynthesis C-methylase UbiE